MNRRTRNEEREKWIKRRLSMFAAFVCLLVLTGCAGRDAGGYMDAKNGVVVVSEDAAIQGVYTEEGYAELNGAEAKIATGSGFFVGEAGADPQYLITNYHVIEAYLQNGAGEQMLTLDESEETISIMKCYVRVYFGNDDYEEAYVVDHNEKSDVALLRLDAPTDKRRALPLRVPDSDMSGMRAYAIGFPGVSDNIQVDALTSWGLGDVTFTSGVISRLATTSGTGVKNIQVDIDLKHGNSGGPLVDEEGNVLGINTWGYTNVEEEKASYAINIEEAISLLKLHNIPYATASSQKGVPGLLIVGTVAAGLVLAAVLILALKKRKTSDGGQDPHKGMPQPGPADSPKPQASAPSPQPQRDPQDSGYRLQGVSGALEGRRIMIRKDCPLTIGRNAQDCNVAFPASTAGVSGSHCQIWFQDGVIYIKDLGSSHGTFLANGMKLSPGQAIVLKPGESFRLGSDAETFVLAQK